MASPELRKKGTPSQLREKSGSIAADEDAEKHATLKPTLWNRFVDKLGLDTPTMILMFKGSLPPIIGIAMYQSTTISSYFTTQGYLIPIISVLAVAVLPRDKFVQSLILNLLLICLGSAMSLLVLWSSIQARTHTSPSPDSTVVANPPYNSSQSAVCAIWLFFNIWLANLIRAKLPSFNMPVVIYSILVNTSTTAGPMIVTTAAAEAFVREQLLAMLFGMALATGVALFIFPISSRMVVMGELKGIIGLLREIIDQQKKYLIDMSEEDISTLEAMRSKDGEASQGKKNLKAKGKDKATEGVVAKGTEAGKRLKNAVQKLKTLAGKLYGNMAFAKRNIAWGKLDAQDLAKAFTLIQNVMIPIVAMSTFMDILQRISKRRGWDVGENIQEKQTWNDTMKQMRVPFEILSELTDKGLKYSGICLEILPQPKGSKKSRSDERDHVDIEALEPEINSSGEGLARLVDNKVQQLKLENAKMLRTWTLERAPGVGEETPAHPQSLMSVDVTQKNQAPLYMSLYMTQLMDAASEAIQALISFADEKVEDGTMGHRRLIIPSEQLLRKWLTRIFKAQHSNVNQGPDITDTIYIYDGGIYNEKRDPEHLPATNTWQHIGTGLRKFSAVLASKESAFGFRVACATMSVAILAFLEKTQAFFHDQRLEWAMFTIALGMTITYGQSVFGFICRVGGTCAGMVFSLVIWYIVDEKTPGIIVLLWLMIFIEYYFFKFPRLVPAVMITVITQIIILGYELQVRKISEAVATHSGQPYYPIYLLGPYRLATIVAGTVVAFLWAVFPYPLTDRAWLRQDVSVTIYLLAKYVAGISSTMQLESQFGCRASDGWSKTSPNCYLLKIRRKIFIKVMSLMYSIKSHMAWQTWEPVIGGRFPVDTYKEIIMRSARIMSYLTLISYTLTHPPQTPKTEDSAKEKDEDGEVGASNSNADTHGIRWWRTVAEVFPGTEMANHTVLSTLILLSNTMLSGHSLPPFLSLPRPYEMTQRLIPLRVDGIAAEPDKSDPLLHHRDPTCAGGNPGMTNIDLGHEAPDQVTPRCQSEEIHLTVTGNPEILNVSHTELRGYAEFNMMQVCNTLVYDDLEGLARAVSQLVGVVDFTFRVDTGGSEMVETPLGRRRAIWSCHDG